MPERLTPPATKTPIEIKSLKAWDVRTHVRSVFGRVFVWIRGDRKSVV
jgi:hypothetical protein